MSLTVAIQMDPLDSIDISGDSTFALAIEAQARGHKLFHYLPKDIAYRDGIISAQIQPLSVKADAADYYKLGSAQYYDLSRMDVVLMRQDPPFNMEYITATHLLEHIHPNTLVVNNPTSVRNAPEKLFVTHFSNVTPPTLITKNRRLITEFRTQHKDIIIKPLFGNGGAGVFHVKAEDENFNALVEMFDDLYPEPFIIQKYLPEIRKGDKRIILINGKPAGGVSRVPAHGEARANLHVGATAKKTLITKRDQEICDII